MGASFNTNSSIVCAAFVLAFDCKSFKVFNGLCQCVNPLNLVITNPDHDRAVKIGVEDNTLKNLPLHFVAVDGDSMAIRDVTFSDAPTINYNILRPGGTDWLKPFVYIREKRIFVFITNAGDVYHWKLGSSSTTKVDVGGPVFVRGFFANQHHGTIFYTYPEDGVTTTPTFALFGGTIYKKLASLQKRLSQPCASFSSKSKDEVYIIGGILNGNALENGIYKMVLSDGSLTYMTSLPGIGGLMEHSCTSFQYEGNPAIFVTAGRKGSSTSSVAYNTNSFVYLIDDNVAFKLDTASYDPELKEPALVFVPPYMYMGGGASHGIGNTWVKRILPAHGQNWESVTSNIGLKLRSFGLLVPIN